MTMHFVEGKDSYLYWGKGLVRICTACHCFSKVASRPIVLNLWLMIPLGIE